MILVTGATGFVGQHVVARLAASGRQVCCLLRPARKERRMPRDVTVRIAAGDVDDPPTLRVAMHNVDTIIHLAALHAEDSKHTFESVNHQGTINVIEAAHDAGVQRLIYLSQIGVESNSAYPFFRSKCQAEDAIRASDLDYTVLRSSMLYGENDDWINNMAMVVKSVPWIFPVIGDGQARYQPLWVEDIVTCIEHCLNNSSYVGKTLEIGGPEYLTLDQIADTLARVLRVRRRKVYMRIPLALWLAGVMKRIMLHPMLTQTAIEGLNVNSVTDLTAIQREFGFEPARFEETVSYLRGQPWRREFLRRLIAGV
jgi:uncharacterized protein YbjT (DUF2867 family)